MKIHSVLMLSLIAICVVPSSVFAASAGESCSKVGETTLSTDQTDMLACLYDSTRSLVWKGLVIPATTTPVASASSTTPPVSTAQSETPTPSPRKRWQGWYAGVNAGVANTTNSLDPPSGQDTNLHGYNGTAGLVGGYNQTTTSGLFYGGEADVNYVSEARHHTDSTQGFWDGYGTIRGRVGMAFDPALVFLTGGVAFVDATSKWQSSPATFSFSASGIRVGWVMGAGTEFSLTDNISMSAQYLWLDTPYLPTAAASPPSGFPHKFQISNSANIIRTGLNWHFN